MTSNRAGSSVPKVLKRTMFCKEQFDELKYCGSTYYVLLQGLCLEPKYVNIITSNVQMRNMNVTASAVSSGMKYLRHVQLEVQAHVHKSTCAAVSLASKHTQNRRVRQ